MAKSWVDKNVEGGLPTIFAFACIALAGLFAFLVWQLNNLIYPCWPARGCLNEQGLLRSIFAFFGAISFVVGLILLLRKN